MRLLLALFFISIPIIAHAIVKVTVRSEYAIVYSDKELTSAIGKIALGKEVIVGSPKDTFAKAVPIIISGRIAYIHVEDLNLLDPILDKDQKEKQSNGSRAHEMALDDDESSQNEDHLFKDNHLLFQTGTFAPRADWEKLSSQMGTSELSVSPFYRLLVEHRPPNLPYSFSVGLGYYSAEEENNLFKMITGELGFSYLPFNNALFSLGPTLTLFYSGNFAVSLRGDEQSPYDGIAYGAHYGFKGVLFPHSRLSFEAGYSYIHIRPSSLRDMRDPQTSESIPMNNITSQSIFFGAALKFM